jgi:HEAT repeat protein
MMQRYCRWGTSLLLLPIALTPVALLPIVGCGPNVGTSDVASSDAGGNAPPAVETTDASSAQPTVVTPPVEPPPPELPPLAPIELPKPPEDKELRERVAQLYSPQIQQILDEARRISAQADSGKTAADVRLEAQQKLAEAEQLRADAVEYLRGQGAGVFEKLKGAMLDEAVDVRRGAAWYLFENVDKNDPQMVAVFVQALADDDRIVRQLAVAGLKGLPPESLSLFLRQLVDLLERKKEEDADRAAVAQLIGRLGRAAAPAFPILTRLAREDASGDVRLQCLFAASKMADEGQAVAMFRAALADQEVDIRKLAAVRLERLAPASAVAVGDLAKALKDQDAAVREYVAISLRKLGPNAAAAAGPLSDAMSDPVEKVRRAAADALVSIGDVSVDPLIRQLESQNPHARQLAIAALSQLGSPAKRGIPALRKLLTDGDPQVRELAKAVLDQLERLP